MHMELVLLPESVMGSMVRVAFACTSLASTDVETWQEGEGGRVGVRGGVGGGVKRDVR